MILKNVRLNYCNLFKSHKNMTGTEDIFDCQIIIEKTNTQALEELKNTIEATIKEAEEKNGKKVTQGMKKFELKDGDSEQHNPKGYEYLKGCYFITLKNKKQPQLLKAIKQNGQILKVEANESDYYNGMYAVVVANPYFYNTTANKGITFYLNVIIKTKDGDKLGKSFNLDEIDIDDEGLADDDNKNNDDWAVL